MNADSRHTSPLLWVPLLLVCLALGLRWMKLESPGMDLLSNFSPWMALAFTGTLVFPRTLPWWIWPTLLLGMNFAVLGLKEASAPESLSIYAMYALAALFAHTLRGRLSVLRSLLGALVCSVAFYIVTNTTSWWVESYSKDFTGWLQALTIGLPGYAPTWTFYTISMLSDLGFSALLLLAFNAEAKVRNMAPMPWLTARAAA